MSRSLQLKVWMLVGYVLVCTAAVLLDQHAEAPQPQAPATLGQAGAQPAP